MSVEKYRIQEVVSLGKGRQTEIIYIDSFDPDIFKQIVANPGEKVELRHRCAIRLLSAGVLTHDELMKLVNNKP